MPQTETQPKHGDMRVWWIPQIPMKAFRVNVKSLDEAMLLLRTLAEYDLFQFENHVKPDYCNMGGLEVFDATDDSDSPDDSWGDWYDDETGDDINDWMRSHD